MNDEGISEVVFSYWDGEKEIRELCDYEEDEALTVFEGEILPLIMAGLKVTLT